MSPTIKLIIDPAKIHELNPENMQVIKALNSFLINDKSEGVWASHEDYQYTYQDIKYQFSFTQSLIKRNRKEGKTGSRYDIFDPDKSPLGKGGYGVVYPITGTIKFKSDKVILKPENHRIVKIQEHNEKDQTFEVIHEYRGLLESGHLHPKPPVFTNDLAGKKSYLVMELADGFPLEKILHPTKHIEIADQLPDLTVHKRLELTFAILNAIKSQVVDKCLIHRDIKPGNIIIDFSKSPIKASIIDYGFYLKLGEQDLRRVGTRAYRGPESFIINPLYTQEFDVYSAGRILSYLWGDNYKNYYIGRDKDLNYIKTKSKNKHLFNDPDIKFFLAKKDQEKIRNILYTMLSEEPEMRPTIDESIEQFSQININKYANFKKPNPAPIGPDHYKKKLAQQIEAIQLQLTLLHKQSINLRQRGCLEAADTMDNLMKELSTNTELLAIKLEPHILHCYQKCCMAEINTAKKILKNHRDSWWLLAEISTAICLLGVGYLIVLGINYLNSNRIGLFSQTKSDQLIDQIKETVLDLPLI